jgi:transitional endoplasmic reticulum ATPase
MQFNSPGIQSLACNFVKEVINSGYYEADALEEIPQVTITALTGKSFQTKGKSDDECLTELNGLLNKPLPNSLLNERLVNNCHVISKALALNEECEPLLQLSVLCTINFGLADFISNHLYYTTNKLNLLVASALNMGLLEIETATLAISNTGLFPTASNEVIGILHLPKALVDNVVGIDARNFKELVEGCFEVLPKSELSLNDYPHLNLEFLTEFMKQAVKQKTSSVNLLIYGDTGVGKTELSKLLAQHCNSNLMTVKAQGEMYQVKKDELTSELNAATLRIQHHALLQSMLGKENCSLLLIDECEDIFETPFRGHKVSKDRLHQVLNHNIVPTIWICNDISDIEPSCLRRFSYILQVPRPPAAIKKKTLKRPLKNLRVSHEFKESLSQIEGLAPAHVTQAANVARLINISGKKAERCIEEHISQNLLACGFDEYKQEYKPQLPFSTDFLNIQGGNQAIKQIAKAVNGNSDLRVLLTGPSGVGKTAVVNHLAEQANKELITVRCSDVLDKYVGSSEKNIARLFRESEEKGAILFFDEVDSLLIDRSSLTQSWEIQQVNELLTQIECFSNPFFASTNYFSRLDTAVARRFDFKLCFEYMTSPQVLKLYNRFLVKSDCSIEIKTELLKMKHLAPGDFAILARRQKICKTLSQEQHLEILKSENDRKQQGQLIGFIQ